jgi:cyclic lactone autoinducer peptide
MRRKIAIGQKVLCVLNSMAIVIVAQIANSTCIWMFHQPKFPEEAKKFSRLK